MSMIANLRIWSLVQCLLNIINHILIFLIGFYCTLLASRLDCQDTANHMFLTVIGWNMLGAQALMSFYPYNFVTRYLSHSNKSRYHGIMQLIGGSMATWGAIGKILLTEQHFTTWHGKMGLLATCLGCVSLLSGLVNFFQPKFALKFYSPTRLKLHHNFFGILSFTVAMSTIVLGYFTKFFQKHVNVKIIPFFAFVTILVHLLTVVLPAFSLQKKLKKRAIYNYNI